MQNWLAHWPALLAVIIAVPVLKLEDHYFSLATLGIGLVVLLLAIQWSDVTGGTNGLADGRRMEVRVDPLRIGHAVQA